MRSRRGELYNLRDDPAERKNLVDQNREFAGRLASLLQSVRPVVQPVGVEVDEATKRRLRSLGYVE
jgi:hypothetical protein